MHCKWCKIPREQCYAHCHVASDGEHKPDPTGAIVVPEFKDSGKLVLDIPCALCGVSGSTVIEVKEVTWE